MRRLFLSSLAGLAIVVGAVAGVRTPDDASAANSTVNIAGFAFSPGTVNVNVGDTVTWTNSDTVPHTATSAAGVSPAFDTGNIAPGGSASHTFSSAGTFSYFCKIHPNMTATVVVAAASASPTATTSSGGGATATASPVAPRTGTGTSDYGTSSSTWYLVGGSIVLVTLAAGGFVAARRRS